MIRNQVISAVLFGFFSLFVFNQMTDVVNPMTKVQKCFCELSESLEIDSNSFGNDNESGSLQFLSNSFQAAAVTVVARTLNGLLKSFLPINSNAPIYIALGALIV